MCPANCPITTTNKHTKLCFVWPFFSPAFVSFEANIINNWRQYNASACARRSLDKTLFAGTRRRENGFLEREIRVAGSSGENAEMAAKRKQTKKAKQAARYWKSKQASEPGPNCHTRALMHCYYAALPETPQQHRATTAAKQNCEFVPNANAAQAVLALLLLLLLLLLAAIFHRTYCKSPHCALCSGIGLYMLLPAIFAKLAILFPFRLQSLPAISCRRWRRRSFLPMSGVM